MRSAVVGFVLGVMCLQQQAELFNVSILCGMLVALLALYTGSQRIARTAQPAAFIQPAKQFVAGAVFGFIWASAFAQFYLSRELPKEWEGRDLTIVGVVDSLPFSFAQGQRFNFIVEQIKAEDTPDSVPPARLVLPEKIALSWYGGFGNADKLSSSMPQIKAGERWQLSVRLKRPHGNANPYVFDYEVWLLEQNLRATGSVRTDQQAYAINKKLADFVWSPGAVVQRCRAWLRQKIQVALPDQAYAGVLVALVIGEQREIDQSDWQVFNRSGVGHLFSVSGLHITLISGLFAGLMYYLWRHSFFTRASLPLLIPAQKVAALSGMVMAWWYVALAGFAVPAQRTLYMLMVVAIAVWLGRIASVSHILALALGMVVLLDPWAVLWPGFWLSFSAVAIILYASVGRANNDSNLNKSWRTHLHSAVHTQYVVSIGLVPISMLLFGQISLLSPLANALAIPVVSFIVTPLAMLGSVLPAAVSLHVLQFAHLCLEYLVKILEFLSKFSFAVWTVPLPPLWMFLSALVGTLWCLAPRGWPMRSAGLICWLPLLLQRAEAPAQGEFKLTSFDVGQGMALLIETKRHRLLYDTGPYYSPESDGATRVILPYLAARGIKQLDGVIVSHADNDHSGGALSVLENVKVAWTSTSISDQHPIVLASARHVPCQVGQRWSWDGVDFEILHPTLPSYENTALKTNARSCTLKITQGKHSVLLAGDIEAAQESELIARDADKLRANVLLAPHHGSGTSSTLAFLQAVRPDLAIFQVGYRNRYHHPKAAVYQRYAELGIERVRTDESGAVSLHFGNTLSYTSYRVEHKRYWYGR